MKLSFVRNEIMSWILITGTCIYHLTLQISNATVLTILDTQFQSSKSNEKSVSFPSLAPLISLDI